MAITMMSIIYDEYNVIVSISKWQNQNALNIINNFSTIWRLHKRKKLSCAICKFWKKREKNL